MVSYRIASENDIRAFYGCVPFTMRAVAILVDAIPMALITMIRPRGQVWICADYKPDFEPCLKRFAVLRAVKLAMSMIKDERRVFALADNKPLLERLGFVPHQGDVYRWGG